MLKRLVIFLIINFAALALGGIFTEQGVNSQWYDSLIKASWTPPGWMFGAAWTTIMVCFSFYMSYLWGTDSKKKMLGTLFAIQWILNVSWNPVFFYFQEILGGLVCIVLLTFLIGFIMQKYWSVIGPKSLFIVPYFVWLLIATSLNTFIFFNN